MQELIDIQIDTVYAMAVVANIQMATRHPLNTGPSRKIAENFARKLQQRLKILDPEHAGLMDLGWQPEYDIVETVTLAEVITALQQAVAVIRLWHKADDVWGIYYDQAPEMESIREVMAKIEANVQAKLMQKKVL